MFPEDRIVEVYLRDTTLQLTLMRHHTLASTALCLSSRAQPIGGRH